MRPLTCIAAFACLACVSGCASFAPPKPWEKQYLAKPEMQFDFNKSEARQQERVYASKEAATGGYGIGGGGCGCN